MKDDLEKKLEEIGYSPSWDFIQKSCYRIYYKPLDHNMQCSLSCDEGHGFNFAVFLSYGVGEGMWDKFPRIEILFIGAASSIGTFDFWVRWDAENNGFFQNFAYFCCRDFPMIIQILNDLRSLEIKHCSVEPDKEAK